MKALYRNRRACRRLAMWRDCIGWGDSARVWCIRDFLQHVHEGVQQLAEDEVTWQLVKYDDHLSPYASRAEYATPLDYRLQLEVRIIRRRFQFPESNAWIAGSQSFHATAAYRRVCTRSLTTRRRAQLFAPPAIPEHGLCVTVDRHGRVLHGDHAYFGANDWHRMEEELASAVYKIQARFARRTTPILVAATG